MPAAFGPLERAHAGDVRRDGRDRQPVVDQGLEVRARAGDEDADHLVGAKTTPSIPASTRPITGSPDGGRLAAGTTAQ